MSFIQPKLPYELKALTPYLSEEQMSYHYGKHHAAYFSKLNALVEGKPEANKSLEELIVTTSGPIFNNAAQAWNHTFFWHCLTPDRGTSPSASLTAAIATSFGSLTAFQEQFTTAAISLFGSGWVWLVKDNDKLEILALSNADTPLKHGKTALLTLDVWEHAYYIDYRNDRARFAQNFWPAVNWPFVGSHLV